MSKSDSCCSPKADTPFAISAEALRQAAHAVSPAPAKTREALAEELVALPGGRFEMGTHRSTFPADQDSPRRAVILSPFCISPYSVTNARFAEFVAATGYKTVAEKFGWSFVFHLLLEDLDRWPQYPPNLPWWRRVDGAYWAQPIGPGSSWEDVADHPVVHVAWFDALAYCKWAGLRLPSEAEWEFAARGGRSRQKFPWGDELHPNGAFMMNTWQGEFPIRNTGDDGYIATAPVYAFQPNGYGMWNMTGNVWEWVVDGAGPRASDTKEPMYNPVTLPTGLGRIQRGGSYLCHVSYCDRYQVHSRTTNDADSSTGHVGFRVAADEI